MFTPETNFVFKYDEKVTICKRKNKEESLDLIDNIKQVGYKKFANRPK